MKQVANVLWPTGSFYLCWLMTVSHVHAQSIQIDGTTPTTPGDCTSSCLIEGGLQRGSNLFHSFSQFNVDSGAIVRFQDPGVINILSRVTGSQHSDIFGTLGVSAGSNANLFLMNPNGIIFGPDATLDVGGSFIATTADAIQFGQQGVFTAAVSDIPLLTIDPSALIYQGENGSIENRSMAGLSVPVGQSLLLIGGDVNLDGGQIFAFGGRVELGGLAEAGTVVLAIDGPTASLNFPHDVAKANVSLTNGALVDVTAANGSIVLSADKIDISGSQLFAGIIEMGTADSQAGDITLNASGRVTLSNETFIDNSVLFGAIGNSGDIDITAKELFLNTGAFLGAATFGQGNAGNIIVEVIDQVSLDASFIINNVETTMMNGVEISAIGDGGNIAINAGELVLKDGSLISTAAFGQGRVGDVSVKTTDSVSLSSDSRIGSTLVAGAGAIPEPGQVSIEASALSLTDGAQISTFPVGAGLAAGGDITIQADVVNISGFSDLTGFSSGLFAFSEENTIGPAGNIIVISETFRIADGAAVSAQTFNASDEGSITITANTFEAINGGQILTTTNSSGDAGDITLNVTERILLSGSDSTFADRLAQFGEEVVDNQGPDSGLFASTGQDSSGDGGNILVDSIEVVLQDGALISVDTQGTGQAGNIMIKTEQLTIQDEATVSSSTAGMGDAGEINLFGTRFINIRNSDITSSVEVDGQGQAGSIFLEAPEVIVSDASSISSSTEGIGDAGSIQVKANTFDLTGGSQLQTNTESANAAGDIILQIRDRLNISGDNTGLFASTSPNSSGDGGNIFVDPIEVILQDGAQISVNSQGSGIGGNIFLQAQSLLLNRASITAETNSTSGGNITINLEETFFLRNSSQISTTAFAGGDGGDITIFAPFIFAIPGENSDIRANAFSGQGGNIQITTQGLFGFVLNQQSPLSDIDASSELGIDGSVVILNADFDPRGGIVELPGNPIDPSQVVFQGCAAYGDGPLTELNEFIVTGRGGIPQSPIAPINSNAIIADWVSHEAFEGTTSVERSTPLTQSPAAHQPMVEAQGWQIGENGKIRLTARSLNPAHAEALSPGLSCGS